MRTWLVVGAVLIGAVVLDRLLLWLERRGWVYWRRSDRPSGGGLSGAAFEVAALFQPTQHVLVEERAKQEAGESDESGEGDPDDQDDLDDQGDLDDRADPDDRGEPHDEAPAG